MPDGSQITFFAPGQRVIVWDAGSTQHCRPATIATADPAMLVLAVDGHGLMGCAPDKVRPMNAETDAKAAPRVLFELAGEIAKQHDPAPFGRAVSQTRVLLSAARLGWGSGDGNLIDAINSLLALGPYDYEGAIAQWEHIGDLAAESVRDLEERAELEAEDA